MNKRYAHIKQTEFNQRQSDKSNNGVQGSKIIPTFMWNTMRSTEKIKKVDLSIIPRNKRYDFVKQHENDINQSNKKLDRINCIEQKMTTNIYPAGFKM